MTTDAELLDVLRVAALGVRRTLEHVGQRAKYVWPVQAAPGDPVAWSGYSYEIPKEEQVRSALWAALHASERVACELEWDIFEKHRAGVRAAGEIDIAGFLTSGEPSLPVLLLEIKRWWRIDGWNNKLAELRHGVEIDLEKLRGVVDQVRNVSAAVPLFAGVVVVGFTDRKNGDDRTKLRQEWLKPLVDDWRVEELWDWAHTCESPLNANAKRQIWSRADVVRVAVERSAVG